MRIFVFAILTLFVANVCYSQTDCGEYHIQTYESLMSIDDYNSNDSSLLDEYLSLHWNSFILTNGKHNYFNDILLSTDLLRFRNHNLFSRFPIKCLENNFEHYFYLSDDSLTFWFGGMGMTTEVSLQVNDSTFILFPNCSNKNLTIIKKISDSVFEYNEYKFTDELYTVTTDVKSRNKFKNTLGIRNKRNLMVMLFRNVIN